VMAINKDIHLFALLLQYLGLKQLRQLVNGVYFGEFSLRVLAFLCVTLRNSLKIK